MSNLSDIGFPTPDEQSVNEMIMHVLELTEPIKTSGGFYLKYTDVSGAEIYLQGNPAQELIGFNPHFAGNSRRRVLLNRKIERDSSELDGGFYAWANPLKENFRKGEYSFVFDVPDFRLIEINDFPVVKEIQLTAFASNDFKIHAGAEEFDDAQDSELKYAAKSFAASGLFSFDEQDETIDLSVVRPIAMMAGEIKEFARKTNQLSGQDFYYFLVETRGGEIDVVADPKFIPEEPQIGSIVSGQFWLSGRIF